MKLQGKRIQHLPFALAAHQEQTDAQIVETNLAIQICFWLSPSSVGYPALLAPPCVG